MQTRKRKAVAAPRTPSLLTSTPVEAAPEEKTTGKRVLRVAGVVASAGLAAYGLGVDKLMQPAAPAMFGDSSSSAAAKMGSSSAADAAMTEAAAADAAMTEAAAEQDEGQMMEVQTGRACRPAAPVEECEDEFCVGGGDGDGDCDEDDGLEWMGRDPHEERDRARAARSDVRTSGEVVVGPTDWSHAALRKNMPWYISFTFITFMMSPQWCGYKEAFWDLGKEDLARHEAEALKFDPSRGDLFHSMQLMLNGMYALRNLGWHVLSHLNKQRAGMWRWLEQMLALDPKRLHAMWKGSPTLFSRQYLKLSYYFVMFMLPVVLFAICCANRGTAIAGLMWELVGWLSQAISLTQSSIFATEGFVYNSPHRVVEAGRLQHADWAESLGDSAPMHVKDAVQMALPGMHRAPWLIFTSLSTADGRGLRYMWFRDCTHGKFLTPDQCARYIAGEMVSASAEDCLGEDCIDFMPPDFSVNQVKGAVRSIAFSEATGDGELLSETGKGGDKAIRLSLGEISGAWGGWTAPPHPGACNGLPLCPPTNDKLVRFFTPEQIEKMTSRAFSFLKAGGETQARLPTLARILDAFLSIPNLEVVMRHIYEGTGIKAQYFKAKQAGVEVTPDEWKWPLDGSEQLDLSTLGLPPIDDWLKEPTIAALKENPLLFLFDPTKAAAVLEMVVGVAEG